VRLSNQATVVKVSGRRQAVSWEQRKMAILFADYHDTVVKFKDEDGERREGVLINFLNEGVFVIRTDDGQEHDVHTEDIKWGAP